MSCQFDKILSKGECVSNCKDSMFLTANNTCEPCQIPCDKCYSLKLCKSCAPSYFMQPNSTECSSKCPDGYFGNSINQACSKCYFTCKTCVGSEANKCLDCDIQNGYTKDTDEIGECRLAVCLDGFYTYLNKNTNKIECHKCHESCLKCDTSDSREYCLECKKPLFQVASSIPLHFECKSCEEHIIGSKTGSKGDCIEICGDGLNIGLNECDDGNTNDGDGCNSECKIENGWNCVRRKSESDYCYDIISPTAKLKISKILVLEIAFSESVISSAKTINDFANNIDLRIEGLDKDCNYTWTFIDKINTKIKFENISISVRLNCSLQENAQRFIVEFKKLYMITDLYNNKLATPIISALSKRYLYISDSAKEAVSDAGSSFSISGFATFGIILGVNMLQSTAVESFWAFMNMLQILAYIPIISCELPYNLEIFLTQYLSVSRVSFPFKMLPSWVPNPLTYIRNFLVIPFNTRFELCGFESLSFIYNFSEQLFTWVLLIAFYILIRLICLVIPDNSCLLIHKWKKDYEYNTPIRVLIETYLNMTFCSFVNIWLVFLYFYKCEKVGH